MPILFCGTRANNGKHITAEGKQLWKKGVKEFPFKISEFNFAFAANPKQPQPSANGDDSDLVVPATDYDNAIPYFSIKN